MEPSTLSFTQWLRRQRRARDLTQEELANRLGLALVSYRKIESGERRPSKEVAQRLAEVFSVPEADRANFIAFARALDPDAALAPVSLTAPDTRVPIPQPRGVQAARLNNLPIQLTSFVGREREMERVLQLLDETRLLTLTGAGGSGKTRLALQVAGRLVDADSGTYPDGIWLVDLARLADPDLLPQAVASGLGLRDEGLRPLIEQLVDYFRSRKLLLLLDNCEHLIESCALAADKFLRAAPALTILATSPEQLGIDGELTFYVPSMPGPDPRRLPPLEQVAKFDAVRLFAERAAAAHAGFDITADNATAVAEICEQLDGMPLAIELAASRTKVLPVVEIRNRLAGRFQLLTGGSRVALPRHQTLRATIEWSYALLSEPERALLRSLAVFAGGWTLDAAEAVCAPAGSAADKGPHGGDAAGGEGRLLDLLTHLIDKSLVVPEWRGRPDRYGILETIRQFALEQLETSGEATEARRRHARCFVGLAEEAEPKLMSTAQRAWQIRLEDEHNNIQVALDWLMSAEAARVLDRPKEEALRLGGALWRYWEVRGRLAEGLARLKPLVSSPDPDCDPNVLGRGYLGAGVCSFYHGDFAAAHQYYEASVALYRQAGDQRAMTRPLTYLGWMDTYRTDFARARGELEEALAISRAVGDLQAETWATARLGIVAYWAGDPLKGIPLLERALSMSREMGDELGTGWWLLMLGQTLLSTLQFDRALPLLEECIRRTLELGDRRDYAYALLNLAWIAAARSDHIRAFDQLDAAMRIFGELGDILGVCFGLASYSYGLAATHPVTAVQVAGKAWALAETLGVGLPLHFQAIHEQLWAAERRQIGDEAFEAAWEQGRALQLEQAVSEAVALSEALRKQ